MRYPVPNDRSWKRFERASAGARLSAFFRNWRFKKRRENKSLDVRLTQIGGTHRPLGAADVPLICLVRNSELYLQSFLSHYRGLGVTRFIMVDDNSDDRTRQTLLQSGDVDLYGSNIGYRAALGGLIWRDLLIDLYGRDRWYVSVDIDEFLIYPGCESRPLGAFFADLDRAQLRRGLASMIDIYPEGPLADAVRTAEDDALPTAVSPFFDGDSYRIKHEKFSTTVRGGPRTRIFGNKIRLSKFPVLYADAATIYNGGSIHGPLPIYRNFSAVHAVLLHYKFSSSTVAEFREIVGRGQHYGGAQLYRAIVDSDQFGDAMTLQYDGSRRYAGSEDLVVGGFMKDLRV